MITDINNRLKGCEYLFKNAEEGQGFFPEDFSEEHKMIMETAQSFVDNDVRSVDGRIEKMEEGLAESLMVKMGELGFLGAHMPEELGGMELDFISNSIIGEIIGKCGSFSVTYNAHTGIGMLPILYFGTESQKLKYLPKLITGEEAASYCLTEPSSGSDALSAKTVAYLNDEGTHYILNGQKMWITNAGFANIFIVFAQVEGNKFTGFIAERGMEGLTLGAEEDKLGIKGSSTRQVFFENVKIPVGNVLGEIGKGHLIAFNVLNIGRYKLGISCLGGTKSLVDRSIEYANERHQFKVPIASFGAIKHKIAEQSIRTFACESTGYRIADLINQEIEEQKALGKSFEETKLVSAEEYALECSIYKILGSEVLDYVVDEAVQIHGGMGYSEEGVIARSYRDARINRIFEGTNEINRLLMGSILFKRAMKGEVDIASPAMKVQQELMSGHLNGVSKDYKYYEERKAVSFYKKLVQVLLGYVGQMAMSKTIDLKNEQEVMMNLADIMIDIFNTESTLLRVEKMAQNSHHNLSIYEDVMRTLIHDANYNIQKNALDLVAAAAEGDMMVSLIKSVKALTKYPLQNVKENRRRIADFQINANKYSL